MIEENPMNRFKKCSKGLVSRTTVGGFFFYKNQIILVTTRLVLSGFRNTLFLEFGKTCVLIYIVCSDKENNVFCLMNTFPESVKASYNFNERQNSLRFI